MKKNTKKMLTLSVFAAFALSMCVGIGATTVVKATDEQATVTADFSDFTLDGKASVRKVNPKGIRFTATVGERTRASLAEATDVTFGMLIAPTFGSDEKLTFEDVTDESVKARNVITKVWTDNATSFETTTSYTYNSALVGKSIAEDFPADEYATPLHAVGYVKYTDAEGEKIVYTTNSSTRSLAQTASLALANGESDSENVLSDIIDAVVPDELSVGAVEAMEYGATTTLTAEGTQGLAVIWSSSDTSVATVDKLTGEVTAVGIGTAEITATLGTRTATTTVSVQDKVGVISAAHFAKAGRNAYAGEISLIEDEEYGRVATSTLSIPQDSRAAQFTLKGGDTYVYFGDYDYLELTLKFGVDPTASNVKNTSLYLNRNWMNESDETAAGLNEISEWKTVRFNSTSTTTSNNARGFAMIKADKQLQINLVNASSTAGTLDAPMYLASIVGGYSNFEVAHGTAIDLTAKYKGIKSAMITPTGSTEAQTISDLTAWTPVAGTLSFIVGKTGWLDNSYTVNVTLVDNTVGTISAKTIAGATCLPNTNTISLIEDEEYGMVATSTFTVAPGGNYAHYQLYGESYKYFGYYDYLDFTVKFETNIQSAWFYINQDSTKIEDLNEAKLANMADWSKVRINRSETNNNTKAFDLIKANGIDLKIQNTAGSSTLNGKMYLASIVGGFYDVESDGTAINLTEKYNGIKSATITPTGSTEAQPITTLTAWTPVAGTLSFTIGHAGWADMTYTVNVTVA